MTTVTTRFFTILSSSSNLIYQYCKTQKFVVCEYLVVITSLSGLSVYVEFIKLICLFWQSDAVLSSAGQKRVHLSDSEQDSPDEPQCRRYRSSIDDAVDFEMMLQDVSSRGENPRLDSSDSQPVSENGRTLSQERVIIKSEPVCNTVESVPAESQPLNFSLSQNTGNALVDGKPSRVGDDKICPSSPDLATTSVTSPVNCSDSDAARLHKELAAAVAANLALQEELSSRDFHLAQLAEDFFCLHEQFKQLARHFQTVLGDIQPVSDESGINQIAHNHTSSNC